MTNYERITASPKALAEFIQTIAYECGLCLDGGVVKCCTLGKDNKIYCVNNTEKLIEWLNRESE